MPEKGNSEPSPKKPRADITPAEVANSASAAPDQRPVSAGSHTAPVSFTLNDEEVLDCPVCFDPLSSPVYQCKNGHVACASCCASIKKKCPSCSCPTGNIRCRAVEKIIESITLDCQNKAHGCEEKVSYAKKLAHLVTCKYAPCCCPLSSCDFVGSSECLYEHFSASHSADHYFSFGTYLYLKLDDSQEHAFLQEKVKKVVFVISRIKKPHGTLVKLVCIAPASSESAANAYHVKMKAGSESIGMAFLMAPVECMAKWDAEFPTTSYLMVPCDMLGSSLRLSVGVGSSFINLP